MTIKDPEEIILQIVNHFGFIRRNRLYEELKKGLKDEKISESRSKTSYSSFKEDMDNTLLRSPENFKTAKIEPLSVSKVTFNRILKRLIALNKLKNLKYPDYERLGIYPVDKKASYITLYKTFELIKHYDRVLDQVDSKDPIKKKNALIEIESMMEGVVFTPEQLDKLSEILSKEDHLGENIIRILYFSIDRKKIFPAKMSRFQKNLVDYYRRKDERIDPNTKAHIIHILALFNNPIVIEFLKKDVEVWHKDFDKLSNEGYCTWAIAKIVEDNLENLFEFQNKLEKESDSLTIFKIRRNARNMLLTYENSYPEFERKLEGRL